MTNETTCRKYLGLACIGGNCPNGFLYSPIRCSECSHYHGCEDCAFFAWQLCKDRSMFSPADTGTREDRPPADPLEESISELKAANDELKTYLRKRKETAQ